MYAYGLEMIQLSFDTSAGSADLEESEDVAGLCRHRSPIRFGPLPRGPPGSDTQCTGGGCALQIGR